MGVFTQELVADGSPLEWDVYPEGLGHYVVLADESMTNYTQVYPGAGTKDDVIVADTLSGTFNISQITLYFYYAGAGGANPSVQTRILVDGTWSDWETHDPVPGWGSHILYYDPPISLTDLQLQITFRAVGAFTGTKIYYAYFRVTTPNGGRTRRAFLVT